MLIADQEPRSYDEFHQDIRNHSGRDQEERNNKKMENEYIFPYPVTQKNETKHTHEDQTVTQVESNIGTGIGEHILVHYQILLIIL